MKLDITGGFDTPIDTHGISAVFLFLSSHDNIKLSEWLSRKFHLKRPTSRHIYLPVPLQCPLLSWEVPAGSLAKGYVLLKCI